MKPPIYHRLCLGAAGREQVHGSGAATVTGLSHSQSCFLEERFALGRFSPERETPRERSPQRGQALTESDVQSKGVLRRVILFLMHLLTSQLPKDAHCSLCTSEMMPWRKTLTVL